MIDEEIVKNIPFFSTLSEDILNQLSNISYKKDFFNGDILFYEDDHNEDDHNEDIFYLLNGAIKFYKVDRFDNEIFLYKLDSDSIIFDISKLCDEHTMSCYANAEFTQDSTIVGFNKDEFKNLLRANHDFMKIILKESFKMIQQFQCIISRDVVFDGTAKVAHMLANELDSFNSLKKHEIAYMLHIQPETLSRILKKLTRNEIIGIDKNCVEILNNEELQKIYK